MERFTWSPSAVKTSMGFRTVQSQLESGRKRFYCKGRKPRQWTLSFRTRHGPMLEIARFFQERSGPYEPFLWSNPWDDQEDVVVRFGEDSLDIEGQWSSTEKKQMGIFSLVLEEVL